MIMQSESSSMFFDCLLVLFVQASIYQSVRLTFQFSFSSVQLMNKSDTQLIHAYTTTTEQSAILIKILLCTAANVTESVSVCCRMKITMSAEILQHSCVLFKRKNLTYG